MRTCPNAPYPCVLDIPRLNAFLARAFPVGAARGSLPEVVALSPGFTRLRARPAEDALRPGGVVSGPTLMAIADTAAYALVISAIGDKPMALTHTLSISFLRPCLMADVLCEARLLKLGRRLATVDARLYQNAVEAPIAQATIGYALP